jgi:hypothetical protein
MCQFVLSILGQSVTLLHRGQTLAQLPSPLSHPEYYLLSFFCIGLQAIIIYAR